jgi:hypothetical protein
LMKSSSVMPARFAGPPTLRQYRISPQQPHTRTRARQTHRTDRTRTPFFPESVVVISTPNTQFIRYSCSAALRCTRTANGLPAHATHTSRANVQLAGNLHESYDIRRTCTRMGLLCTTEQAPPHHPILPILHARTCAHGHAHDRADAPHGQNPDAFLP